MAQYIAVGQTGTVLRSSDGVNWIPTAQDSTSTFNALASNGSLYVALGSSGKGIHSTDGITWEDNGFTPTLPSFIAGSAISPEGWTVNSSGTIVIVELNSPGRIFYSTDGQIWKLATVPVTNKSWYEVAAVGNTFVATASNNSGIARSTDGITWTWNALDNAALTYSIAGSNDKFVRTPNTNSANAYYSTDGITWTLTLLPAPGAALWYSIGSNGTQFIVTTNTSSYAYSTDGISWSSSTYSFLANYRINWTGSEYIATGSSAASVYSRTTDGITWTTPTLPASGVWYIDCTPDGTVWQATISTSATVYHSTNGVTWTNGSALGSVGAVLKYYNGYFLHRALSTSINTLYRVAANSSSTVYGNNTSTAPYALEYVNGVFLAASSNVGSGICYSTNGLTWSFPVNAASTFTVGDFAYGNGKYILVGSGGKFVSSTDLVTWSGVTSVAGATSALNAVVYANGQFVAVGDASTIAYSSDGIIWYLATAAIASRSLRSIVYANGVYVVTDTSGTIHKSLDGIKWVSTYTAPSGLNAIAYNQNKNELVAVGTSGVIIKSESK